MFNKNLTKQLQDRNFKKYGLDLNLQVTTMSLITLLLLFSYAFYLGDEFYSNLLKIQSYILILFKPLYIITFGILIFICIFLAFSKIGKIKLGGQDAKVEYKRFSWYSMLFSAGMGIGLVFYGVAEPIMHQNTTPLFKTDSSIDQALATTFLHWGFQAWSIYALVGLALAYYCFNKNLPMSPRSLLYPIFKDKIFGFFGDIIDSIIVSTTLLALASSLGLGAAQVNSGLLYLFGIPISNTAQILIISIITFIATLSVVSGMKKGIKVLSEINIYIAIFIMTFIFFSGPTISIIKHLFSSIFIYITQAPVVALTAGSVSNEWLMDWTLFYWAWWVSWAVFVGMFIAKVSYGRTIKDFIISTILIPTIFIFLWFTTLGVSGILTDSANNFNLTASINNDISNSLYELFNLLIHNNIILFLIQLICMFLVISFFVTSSDSGSIVVDGLASGGQLNSPKSQKIFWAVAEGVLALFILIVGGSDSFNLIQTLLIISSFPLLIYIIIAGITLIRDLIIETYY